MRKTFIPALVALVFSTAFAFALTVPATFAPRDFNTQQTGYYRINITATGTGISANGNICIAAVASGGNCYVKVGALPVNAYLVRIYQGVGTAFNGTTTDTISVCVSTTANEIMNGTSVHTGASTLVASEAFKSGGSGTLLTTVNPQSGVNGGYDLYVKYTYTGSAIATAGQVVYILEYIAPNDGTCVATPIGTAPVAC